MLIASEVLIGLAIGFSVQIGFASARVAGEVISNAMGLGFATMYDPISAQASSALSQLLYIFALAHVSCARRPFAARPGDHRKL